MVSATHEELVEVHDDAADSSPGGEGGDIGAFVGWAERIGGHLLRVLGRLLKIHQHVVVQPYEPVDFSGHGLPREDEPEAP